jgi:monoamine oxidase
MLADRAVLSKLGFSQREVEFLARHEWWELPNLFYGPYLDNFGDEYQPFGAGLDQLDDISVTELLKKEKASDAALLLLGGQSVSALQTVWHAAILKRRGVPLWPKKVFRVEGGNQRLTDAFAARLGDRLRLGVVVEGIEAGESSVRVRFSQHREPGALEGDFLVCAVSAVALRRIPVTPPWSPEKAFAIQNMPYYSESRVMIQCRSRFWEERGVCPNITSDDPRLNQVWSMAEEVKTSRGMLVGTAQGVGSREQVLAAFKRYFPDHERSIEHVVIHAWPQDPLASACETVGYHVGELKKFWPHAITPWRRIHFAGAYCDNLNWGMEAATRSANRVAAAIDRA